MIGRPPKGIETLTVEQRENLSNKDWLYHQHHILNKTLRTISSELGVGRWYLTTHFKTLNIPIKKFPHISLKTHKKIDDIELLKKMHYEDKMTIEDIAEYFGVKDNTIRRRFRENNITRNRYEEKAAKRRQKTCEKKYGVSTVKHLHIPAETLAKLDNKDWLFEQHVTSKKSCIQIAEELGVERTVVDSRLFQHGIEKFYYRRSINEIHLVDFLMSFYGGEVKTNVRNLIKPNEIEVYIPEYNIAIEYNGLYWHTTQYYSSRLYHLTKTRQCEARGIRLFHIMEDEWDNKQDIWKSIIRNSLGYHSLRVYARDTEVVEVDLKTRKNFLTVNHLQGDLGSQCCFGLKFDNELVSIMSFGKPRFNKNHEWELLRYCSKLDTSVVGGASRLFTAFVRKYQPNSVISYMDRRYGGGSFYNNLGFSFVGNTEPNYWYLIGDKLEQRYLWQKHKLVKKLKFFDPLLSEQANMKANGYFRIYDCGSSVFSWIPKKI